MTSIRIVEHSRTPERRTLAIMVAGRVVGTAVEITGDRVAPWRLTIKGCCANVRRSSWTVVEQTIERFAAERPDAFAPPPSSATAWVPAAAELDAIAAELQGKGVRVHRTPLPPHRAVERIDQIILAHLGGV